jgi:hypothetical protein
MRVTSRFLVAFAALALFAGCATTSLEQSWKDPGAPTPLPAGSVLAVAITDNASARRAAEDEMVRLIGPVRARASYTFLSESDLQDEATAKAKLAGSGLDYALTLRTVSANQELTWVGGASTTHPVRYRSFWGYNRYGWGTYYDPGYVRSDTVLNVETILYSLSEEKVLWAGVTKTVNPSTAEKLVREIAEAAVKDMRKKGLLAAR